MPSDRIIIVCPNPAVEVAYTCNCFSLRSKNDAELWIAAGGKGINVARILKSLDSNPLVFTCLGGVFGDFIEQYLLSADVKCKSIRHNADTRISTVIYVEQDPEPTVIRSGGASFPRSTEAQLIEELASYLSSDDLVCISGSLPRGFSSDFIEIVLQMANEHDAHVLVDVSGEPLVRALQSRPYLIKVNYEEMRDALCPSSGKPVEPAELLQKALAAGVENVIITFGRDGWLGYVAGRHLRCTIEPNFTGFDAGAGDAMFAGLLHFLSNGRPWSESLEFATRVAAASTFCRSSGEIVLEKIWNSPRCHIQEV